MEWEWIWDEKKKKKSQRITNHMSKRISLNMWPATIFFLFMKLIFQMKYANKGIKQLHKYSDTFEFERRNIDIQFKASQAWPLKIAPFFICDSLFLPSSSCFLSSWVVIICPFFGSLIWGGLTLIKRREVQEREREGGSNGKENWNVRSKNNHFMKNTKKKEKLWFDTINFILK